MRARAAVARHGEALRLEESDREVEALPHPGDLPLIVISHRLPDLGGAPPRHAEQAEAVWMRLQAELAHGARGGRLWLVPGSGYELLRPGADHERPRPCTDLIVRAVHELLLDFRSGAAPA